MLISNNLLNDPLLDYCLMLGISHRKEGRDFNSLVLIMLLQQCDIMHITQWGYGNLTAHKHITVHTLSMYSTFGILYAQAHTQCMLSLDMLR